MISQREGLRSRETPHAHLQKVMTERRMAQSIVVKTNYLSAICENERQAQRNIKLI